MGAGRLNQALICVGLLLVTVCKGANTDVWREEESLPVQIRSATCQIYKDELILVAETDSNMRIDGVEGSQATFFYSFENQSWSSDKKDWTSTQGLSSVVLDTIMYVHGQADFDGKTKPVYWSFDPSTRQWSPPVEVQAPVFHPAIPHHSSTATTTQNGTLLCGGIILPHESSLKESTDLCTYVTYPSPTGNATAEPTVKKGPSLPASRQGACAPPDQVPGGELIFAGGSAFGADGDREYYRQVYSIPGGDGEWNELDNVVLSDWRGDVASVGVEDRLWCVGGKGNDEAFPTVDIYDMKLRTMSRTHPLPNAHSGGCGVLYKNRVWVVGGQMSDGGASDAFYSIQKDAVSCIPTDTACLDNITKAFNCSKRNWRTVVLIVALVCLYLALMLACAFCCLWFRSRSRYTRLVDALQVRSTRWGPPAAPGGDMGGYGLYDRNGTPHGTETDILGMVIPGASARDRRRSRSQGSRSSRFWSHSGLGSFVEGKGGEEGGNVSDTSFTVGM